MGDVSRKLGLLLGLGASVALVFYAKSALQDQDLSRYASTQSLVAIVAAAMCYSTIIPISAWAWRLLLKDLGIHRPWRELSEIMAITQLAKYVPGNFGVHLGRAGMAMARGIAGGALVSTMLAEVVLAIAAALAIGLAGISLSAAGTGAVQGDLRGALAIAAALAGIAFLLYLLLRHRVELLTRRIAVRRGWTLDRLLPRAPTMLRAFGAYSVNYLLIGAGVWAMARLLLPDVEHDVGLLCASFALAWVAGFFTPGAPAGLGVREALMIGILGFAYGQADALILVVALRLATMLGDTLCFVAGYAMSLSSRRHLPPGN